MKNCLIRGWMLPLVIVASGATAFASCYMSAGTFQCCKSETFACPPYTMENGTVVYWNCTNKSDVSGGWAVGVITDYVEGSGAHGEDGHKPGDSCGSCRITYYSCGATPNECLPGATLPVECTNEVLSGAFCP